MEKFYKIKEVAAMLQVTRFFVADLIKNGELRAMKIGRTYRITESAILEYKELAESRV